MLEPDLKRIGCEIPFTSFHIYEGGMVSNCCFTWLPQSIGNINQASLLELYKLAASREIRASVLDGGYRFCDKKLCPQLSTYLSFGEASHPLVDHPGASQELQLTDAPPLSKRIQVYFNYDRSCNLQCPSCRNERVLFSLKDLPPQLRQTHENTVRSVQELLDYGYEVTVNVTGSGDAFASPLYWDYLKTLKAHPRLTLNISTNGVLMENERLLPHIRDMLGFANISVDAATEATYQKVRKGGHFLKLRKNVQDFDRLACEKKLPKLGGWQVNFIVQYDNFREIVPFTEWALSHSSLSFVWFNLIANWGHLSKEKFEEKAIWMSSHPLHEEFLEILKHPILRSPRIHLGSLSTYVKKAAAANLFNPPQKLTEAQY